MWIFGLPAAGKTTVSMALKKLLESIDVPVILFDGDATREIVAEGVGRSIEERKLITRRYCKLTSYLTSSKVIIILAAINHTNEQRAFARENHPEGQFGLVWVNTPTGVCMERDPKGLYRRARTMQKNGEKPEVVGFDIPFEQPDDADVVISTNGRSPECAARDILEYLIAAGSIDAQRE